MNTAEEFMKDFVRNMKENILKYYPSILNDMTNDDVHSLEVTIEDFNIIRQAYAVKLSNLEVVKFNQERVKLDIEPIVIAHIINEEKYRELTKLPVTEVRDNLYSYVLNLQVLGKYLIEDTTKPYILLQSLKKELNKKELEKELYNIVVFAFSELEYNLLETLPEAKGGSYYLEPEKMNFNLKVVTKEEILLVWEIGSINFVTEVDTRELEPLIISTKLNLDNLTTKLNTDNFNDIETYVRKICNKQKKDLTLDNGTKVRIKEIPSEFKGISSKIEENNYKVFPRVLYVLEKEEYQFMIKEVVSKDFVANVLIVDNKNNSYFVRFGANGIYLDDIVSDKNESKLQKSVFLYKKDSDDSKISTLEGGTENLAKFFGKNMFTKSIMNAYDLRKKAGFEEVKEIVKQVPKKENKKEEKAEIPKKKEPDKIKSTGTVFEISEEERQNWLFEHGGK